MYIKISRLALIIIASIFIGMSIIFCIEFVVAHKSPTLPFLCILSMLLLITFIFALQYASNKSKKEEAEQKGKLTPKTEK